MTELLHELQQVEAELMAGVFDDRERGWITELRPKCYEWVDHANPDVQRTAASILYWLGIDAEYGSHLLETRQKVFQLLHAHPLFQSSVADTLLQGWDELDWARMNHAYGKAVDVPIHLKAMCSGDVRLRKRGLAGIINNVYHQGGYCQAVPYTIRFLVRLLAREYPYADMQQEIIDVLLSCFADDEILVYGQTRQALREGMVLYLPYLEHEELEVQDQVIELLGKVGEGHPLAQRVLMDKIERAPWGYQRSLALYAFGYLREWSPEHAQRVVDWMRTHPSREWRRDAAVALIFFHKGKGPVEAWENILDYFLHHQPEESQAYQTFMKWWTEYLYEDLPTDPEGIIYKIASL
ncbi:hypothetical protein [Laceyella putida]|uniref:HEAT repeat domain-containing protein n=1 Tax=Laceyella putida TaxID=110101 RepID=A0ABW2RJJ1_9BACL